MRSPRYIRLLVSPMHVSRLTIALLTVVCATALGQNQTPPLPAADLVNQVVVNELAERAQQRRWMYLIDKREGPQTLTEAKVETKDGPLYRLLAIDGTPLDPERRHQDAARIDGLLHDPSQQLKLKEQDDADEQKLQELMRLMPEAFLYDYDGFVGDLVRVKFRPNSNYSSMTYEARVAHSLAGTVLIDLPQKRLAKLSGQLVSRVEFGYGILGHIDSGGTIEIGRIQVGPSLWKTALINIQLSGRLVFFKTISKQEYETRSHFQEVSGDLSLADATRLLAR